MQSVMMVVRSKNGVPIRVTQERWNHIVQRHPEMEGQKDKVLETVTKPEMIQEGDLNTLMAARFYSETPLTAKYLIVIYKEIDDTDGFILTAYFATKISERRKVLWRS